MSEPGLSPLAEKKWRVGGGKQVLPSNVCVKLDLLDERRFANGMVYLRYHTQAHG